MRLNPEFPLGRERMSDAVGLQVERNVLSRSGYGSQKLRSDAADSVGGLTLRPVAPVSGHSEHRAAPATPVLPSPWPKPPAYPLCPRAWA